MFVVNVPTHDPDASVGPGVADMDVDADVDVVVDGDGDAVVVVVDAVVVLGPPDVAPSCVITTSWPDTCSTPDR